MFRSYLCSSEAVTRGLDHASRVYSTCALSLSEPGYTRVRVVHLLRDKFFLRSGWIASDLGLARGPHINKVPQVGYTRLAGQARSSPAMTEVGTGSSPRTRDEASMNERYLKTGIFLAPFHALAENPLLALDREMELLGHLDR